MPRKGEEVHEPGDIQPAAERLPATAHTWVSDGFGNFPKSSIGWMENEWMDLHGFAIIFQHFCSEDPPCKTADEPTEPPSDTAAVCCGTDC